MLYMASKSFISRSQNTKRQLKFRDLHTLTSFSRSRSHTQFLDFCTSPVENYHHTKIKISILSRPSDQNIQWICIMFDGWHILPGTSTAFVRLCIVLYANSNGNPFCRYIEWWSVKEAKTTFLSTSMFFRKSYFTSAMKAYTQPNLQQRSWQT